MAVDPGVDPVDLDDPDSWVFPDNSDSQSSDEDDWGNGSEDVSTSPKHSPDIKTVPSAERSPEYDHDATSAYTTLDLSNPDAWVFPENDIAGDSDDDGNWSSSSSDEE